MSDDLSQSKRSLRARIRAALAGLEPRQCAEWSAAVRDQLRSALALQPSHAVMAYLPIQAEPDISEFCRDALSMGATLCLPRIDWERGSMSARRVLSLAHGLELTRHGIREPGPDAPVVSPEELEVVLVPGLAFDEAGRRLGRGSGFYDRFLSGLSVRTMGVAFELQLVPEVPAGLADISVGAIATERRLLKVPRLPRA